MGDISVATSPDATSIFYNNGKTAFNANKFGITATYTPWLSELDLKSLYMASVAGFYKLNDNEAVSLGMRYFSMGDLSFSFNGDKPATSGAWTQVSRLGMPLTNEAVIAIGSKDRWNSVTPAADGQFIPFFKNPELAKWMIHSLAGLYLAWLI